MLLSFIIPTYKNVHSLGRAISLIIEHCGVLGLEREIIVIDNYEDDTYLKAIPSLLDSHCIVLKNAIKGAHHSRRLGLAQSHGQIILFVDDDNYLQIDYIKYVVEQMKSANRLTIIGCATQEYSHIDWERNSFEASSFACGSLKNVQFRDNIPVFWGAGLAMSRELAERVYAEDIILDGRVDRQSYIMSGEDHELSIRAFLVGADFQYYEEIGLMHHIQESRINNIQYQKMQIGFKLAAWILRMYYLKFEANPFYNRIWTAYVYNLAMAFAYGLKHLFDLPSQLILKEAYSYSSFSRKFEIVVRYL